MNKRLSGPIFILISAFFYGTYGIWSRLMSRSFGEFSQAWSRGAILFTVIIIANYFFHFFKKIQKADWKWFLAIALAGGLNQAPYFFGFKYLNIGTATLLFYASLVVGGYVIGKFLFNEKIDKVKYLSLGLAVFGMLVIYKLALRPDQFLAAGLTIVAGFMGAYAAIVPKKLSGSYPELQIMSGYFLVMMVANGLLAYLFKDSLPDFSQTVPWLSQIGYCVAMLVANMAVIEGFRYIEASVGSLIGLAEILFGIFFGIIFFGEALNAGIIAGGALVIISAIIPNLYNRQTAAV
jgi:drug/metabolite transporter (DMT)-like permease